MVTKVISAFSKKYPIMFPIMARFEAGHHNHKVLQAYTYNIHAKDSHSSISWL